MRRLLRVPKLKRLNGFQIRQTSIQLLPYTTFASPNLVLDPSSETINNKTKEKLINLKAKEIGSIDVNHFITNSQAAPENVSYFYKLLLLLKANNFNGVISELNSNGSQLNIYELSDIYHLFYQYEKYRQILTIFAIFKQDIVQNLELLELTLIASYKDKNYHLFDDLFKIYIGSTSEHLNADIFNTALKVYLKIDPGLAKQFLYQMFQSDYPINELTIYEYLKVADKESTFQSIQFVIDLLKRYPLTPINDAAYGELYASYHKNGTNHEIGLMMEFLSERQVLEIESVKVAQFLNDLNYHNLPMEEIWRKLHFFKLQQSVNIENLKKIYNEIYKNTYRKMTLEDLLEYFRLMKDDGLPITNSAIHQKIIYQKKNEFELIEYINDIKSKGESLDQYIIKAIWARLSSNNRDFSNLITENLIKFSKINESKTAWIDTLPNLLILRHKRNKEDKYIVSDRYEFDNIWKLEQISTFVKENQDYKIFEMFIDLVRRGIKPDIKVVGFILKSLIKLDSKDLNRAYALIHDVYNKTNPEIEIIYLQFQVQEMQKIIKKNQFQIIKSDRETLINNFALQFQGRLNTEHYIQLASYLIDLHCYKMALSYLSIAKSLIPEGEESRYNSSIYLLTMKSLKLSKNPEIFLTALNSIKNEKNIKINSYMLQRINEYKKQFASKLEGKTKKEFSNEYHNIMSVLKQSPKKQRRQLLFIMKEINEILTEWINEEEKREH